MGLSSLSNSLISFNNNRRLVRGYENSIFKNTESNLPYFPPPNSPKRDRFRDKLLNEMKSNSVRNELLVFGASCFGIIYFLLGFLN